MEGIWAGARLVSWRVARSKEAGEGSSREGDQEPGAGGQGGREPRQTTLVLVRHGKDSSVCSWTGRKPLNVLKKEVTLSGLAALWKIPSAEQVWKQETLAINPTRDEVSYTPPGLSRGGRQPRTSYWHSNVANLN